MNDKKNRGGSPLSLFIWLSVIIFVIALFVFKFNPSLAERVTWSQTQFEGALLKGMVKSAYLTPEPDGVLSVSGEYTMEPVRMIASAAKKEKKNPIVVKDLSRKGVKDGASAPVRYYYTARILRTERLMLLLGNAKNTVVQEESWWRSYIFPAIVGFFLVMLVYFLIGRQMRGAGRGAMDFGRSKARMIQPGENHKTFDDVAGCEEAKEETKEIVEYLKDPLKFKLLGAKIPKGALLMGPPGTGKTLMAKAVAGEANVCFFSISGSDFVEMFVGVGASRVRDMFEQARKNAPCVIFIDEIDAVGRSRFSGIGGGHDEREQTLNAMLVEMDGLETQEGVIVLAATNRADVLDPALLRPGRFDRQIVIDLPDIRGRRQILDVHVKEIKLAPDADLDVIAKSTTGFSGADLANLVNEAALLAARRNLQAAGQAELEEARDKVCFGRERKSRQIPEKERRLTAWHEAGHTIVDLYCEHSVPLHKVTIIPRGQALGMTMMMDDEDRYSKTRLEMLDDMAVDMGGRVAEEIAFGDVTSGASADIAHATKVARAMVCAFGMSEKMGTVQYGERAEHIYLGRDITRNESCSEETLREIDLEILALVKDAKRRADEILRTHKDKLDALAEALLEKETLSVAEIRQLLDLPDSKAEESAEESVSAAEENPSAEVKEE